MKTFSTTANGKEELKAYIASTNNNSTMLPKDHLNLLITHESLFPKRVKFTFDAQK